MNRRANININIKLTSTKKDQLAVTLTYDLQWRDLDLPGKGSRWPSTRGRGGGSNIIVTFTNHDHQHPFISASNLSSRWRCMLDMRKISTLLELQNVCSHSNPPDTPFTSFVQRIQVPRSACALYNKTATWPYVWSSLSVSSTGVLTALPVR